jgi:hypothetical protein
VSVLGRRRSIVVAYDAPAGEDGEIFEMVSHRLQHLGEIWACSELIDRIETVPLGIASVMTSPFEVLEQLWSL